MENQVPAWLAALNDEDLHFLKQFVLVSGSLKALAEVYEVSYPTVRSRLDRLIAKVTAADEAAETDHFRRTVRILLADGMLRPDVARLLIDAYREALAEHQQEERDEPTG